MIPAEIGILAFFIAVVVIGAVVAITSFAKTHGNQADAATDEYDLDARDRDGETGAHKDGFE